MEMSRHTTAHMQARMFPGRDRQCRVCQGDRDIVCYRGRHAYSYGLRHLDTQGEVTEDGVGESAL